MKLNVFIPKADTYAESIIKKGSAIVADPQAITGGHVRAYYEGNIYGAENAHKLSERLVIAAGRLADRYPTTAVVSVPEDELHLVAEYDYSNGTITLSDKDALAAWIDGTDCELG